MRAPTLTFKRARKLRRELTLPEGLLWRALRGKALGGARFRRQHPVGPYILDFYCPAARLAVEVDGQSHNDPEQAAHDRRRDAWLLERGVRTMRIPALSILDDKQFHSVLDWIQIEAGLPPPPPSAVPLPRDAGEEPGSF